MSCALGIEQSCSECRMCQSKEEQAGTETVKERKDDLISRKAILVIDMPENCGECPLLNGADECILQDEDTNFLADTLSDLMAGCPLKKLPDKKECKSNGEWLDFNCGWNACIDEILKD